MFSQDPSPDILAAANLISFEGVPGGDVTTSLPPGAVIGWAIVFVELEQLERMIDLCASRLHLWRGGERIFTQEITRKSVYT